MLAMSTTFAIKSYFVKDSLSTTHDSIGTIKVYHGFVWTMMVRIKKTGRSRAIESYICCEPLNSSKEWMCATSLALVNLTTGKKVNSTVKFSSFHLINWGSETLVTFSSLRNVENSFIIEAYITINDSYIGPPTVTEVKPNLVIFHRLANTFLSTVKQTSSYVANGSTWVAEGRQTEEGLKFVVKKYDSDGRLSGSWRALTVTIRNPSSVETVSGDLGKDIWFHKRVEEQSVVTFLIHDQPFSYHTDVSKGFDFGKEKLSCHIHGNINFTLQDGSTIPLNSYIMAHNSPVLTNLMEEVGELDHDVSDFNPEAVRIFIDACYTGNVDMLKNDTGFEIFSDFVKMVAVFKVNWAKEHCLEFFKRQLPTPSNIFNQYWSFALLALDSVVKYGDKLFLATIPKNTAKFQFRFSEVFAKATKRSHLDLVIAIVVEFGLVDDFLKQILTLLAVQFQIPLLEYWLANFNFALCDNEMLPRLVEVLERNMKAEVVYKFKLSIEKENDDWKTIQPAILRPMGNLNVISAEGTLSTLARSHWKNIVHSAWPCSKIRPFCIIERELYENGEVEMSETQDGA